MGGTLGRGSCPTHGIRYGSDTSNGIETDGYVDLVSSGKPTKNNTQTISISPHAFSPPITMLCRPILKLNILPGSSKKDANLSNATLEERVLSKSGMVMVEVKEVAHQEVR